METPFEYDPYSIMMELFLMEAEEMKADEILLVSRSGHSNLYFVSENRVQKLVKLQSDIAPELALRIAHKSKLPAETVQTVKFKVLENDIGRCITVSKSSPQVDVNCTIEMPAF